MSAPKKKFSDADVQSVVSEVEEAIETLLKSEAAALMKSMPEALKEKVAKTQEVAGDQKNGGDMEKCGDMKMVKDETSAIAPDQSAPPEGSAPPAMPDAKEADPAVATPEESASPEATAMSAAPSEQELCAAYSELSDEELAMHQKCLEQVLASKMAAPAAAPPAPAPGPDAVAPAPGEASPPIAPEMAMKSEKALKEVADLRKTVESLTDALTAFVKRPQFKGITGADVLTKSEVKVETLSKTEIHNRLLAAAKNPKLEKNDRQLIKDYYNGKADVAKMAHLLKQGKA